MRCLYREQVLFVSTPTIKQRIVRQCNGFQCHIILKMMIVIMVMSNDDYGAGWGNRRPHAFRNHKLTISFPLLPHFCTHFSHVNIFKISYGLFCIRNVYK